MEVHKIHSCCETLISGCGKCRMFGITGAAGFGAITVTLLEERMILIKFEIFSNQLIIILGSL
jgi:hypothetical protein